MSENSVDKVTALDVASQGKSPVKIMYNPNDLSEVEKQVLRDEFGWDGKSPVPSDLASRLGVQKLTDVITREQFDSAPKLTEAPPELQAQAASLRDQLPDGFKLPTKDLDVSQLDSSPMVSDSELAAYLKSNFPEALGQKESQQQTTPKDPSPASQQNNDARLAFQQVLQQAANEKEDDTDGLHPEVAQAARMLETGPVQADPLQQRREAAATEEAKAEASEKEEAERLIKQISDEISLEDKEAYQTSVLSFVWFEKQYNVGNGLLLRFRDLSYDAEQMLIHQSSIDRIASRVRPTDYATIDSLALHYRLAASLVSIRINGAEVGYEVPRNTDVVDHWKSLNIRKAKLSDGADVTENDTDLRYWMLLCFGQLLRGSVRQLAIQSFRTFSALNGNLQLLASRPDFLKDQT